MSIGKYFFAFLTFILSQATFGAAAENENVAPSETEVATCLILMTINDDWRYLTTELNESFDVESIVNPFEKKLRGAMASSCSFLFEDFNEESKALIDTRMKKICTDDAHGKNPYLGDGLHCKQALAQ
ncbi:MAG: hypothetical protein AAFX54_02965 [Pseudomonadota bacterium]